jgi:hypothetical protein
MMDSVSLKQPVIHLFYVLGVLDYVVSFAVQGIPQELPCTAITY